MPYRRPLHTYRGLIGKIKLIAMNLIPNHLLSCSTKTLALWITSESRIGGNASHHPQSPREQRAQARSPPIIKTFPIARAPPNHWTEMPQVGWWGATLQFSSCQGCFNPQSIVIPTYFYRITYLLLCWIDQFDWIKRQVSTSADEWMLEYASNLWRSSNQYPPCSFHLCHSLSPLVTTQEQGNPKYIVKSCAKDRECWHSPLRPACQQRGYTKILFNKCTYHKS